VNALLDPLLSFSCVFLPFWLALFYHLTVCSISLQMSVVHNFTFSGSLPCMQYLYTLKNESGPLSRSLSLLAWSCRQHPFDISELLSG
jgi:hypothetical protein